jgi:TrmH family RNA methyltransferase
MTISGVAIFSCRCSNAFQPHYPSSLFRQYSRRNQIFPMPSSISIKRAIQSSASSVLDLLEKEPMITSTKGQTLKLYQSLATKSKARTKKKMSILEGHRLVIDSLTNPYIRNLYHDILVTENAIYHPQLGERLCYQLEKLILENQNCRVHLASDNVLQAACDTVTPQGVVGIVNVPREYTPPPNPSESVGKRKKLYLLLDGISDPGNVGTVLRSSKAVGVEAVVMLPNCCDVWNPKAVRSAMGTTFQVPICTVKSWDECLELMAQCGVAKKNIYAATMEGSEGSTSESFDSIAHYDIDWIDGISGVGSAVCLGKVSSSIINTLHMMRTKDLCNNFKISRRAQG